VAACAHTCPTWHCPTACACCPARRREPVAAPWSVESC
jgi:hypothetical protein